MAGERVRPARRMDGIHGFGIDRVARDAAAAATAATAPGAGPGSPAHRLPLLRLENLDTDLPLPPEAVPATARALATPLANSWLPFTGDLDLRAAVSDLLVDRCGTRYDPADRIV